MNIADGHPSRKRAPWLVAALVAFSCARSDDDQRAVDPGRLPRYSACLDECDQVLLEELRAAVAARPEAALFRDRTISQAADEVRAIRAHGWRHRDRPFRVEPPIDWNADPFGERNWRFQLSAMQFLPPFLQLHAESGDPAPLRFAVEVFLDWIDHNLVRDRPNEFRWYDHATGLRAAYLAYLLDRSLRADLVSSAELVLLLRAARAHVRHLRDPGQLATNNHALFQLAGLAGLCRTLPELNGCDGAIAWADREFARIVESQFTSDGIHAENSPMYQGYALEAIDAVLATGWLDVSPAIASRLELARSNLPWLVRPDGAWVPIGDSFGNASRAQLRRGQPAAGHRAFDHGGYAVARVPSPGGAASDGYLFLTAAWHGQSKGHKHRDALSFEWFDLGAPILVDAGVYSTNVDERREYARSSRAHNTITVDGKDIDRGPPRAPSLIASAAIGETYILAGEVEHPEIDLRHRRILVYRPGQWLLVHDQVMPQAVHTTTAWFHLAAGAGFQPAERIAELPIGRMRIVDLTGRARVASARGQSLPQLQGWVTAAYGKLVPSHAIGLTQRGRAVRFDTLFLVGEEAGTPALVRGSVPSISPRTDLCWQDERGVHGARVDVGGGTLAVSACDR